MKQAASLKKQRLSLTEAWKLLLTLVGFMILLGLSWVILLFTIVGADTNIYAAFAIQWLFVFFNSLQGFFIFIFFVLINADIRNEWKNFLTSSCFKNSDSSSSAKHHQNQRSSAKSSKISLKAVAVQHEKDRKFSDLTSTGGNVYFETGIMNSSGIHEEHSSTTSMNIAQCSTIL